MKNYLTILAVLVVLYLIGVLKPVVHLIADIFSALT